MNILGVVERETVEVKFNGLEEGITQIDKMLRHRGIPFALSIELSRMRNREYIRTWQQLNPQRRRYYTNATRRMAKPISRVKRRLANNEYRIRKINASGSFTAQEWMDLKEQYDNRCAYCGKHRALTIDHKIPLSKGGSNYIDNIIPACQSCNSRKGTKILSKVGVCLTLLT